MGTREAGHNQSRSILQDSLGMGSVLAQDELEFSCQFEVSDRWWFRAFGWQFLMALLGNSGRDGSVSHLVPYNCPYTLFLPSRLTSSILLKICLERHLPTGPVWTPLTELPAVYAAYRVRCGDMEHNPTYLHATYMHSSLPNMGSSAQICNTGVLVNARDFLFGCLRPRRRLTYLFLLFESLVCKPRR